MSATVGMWRIAKEEVEERSTRSLVNGSLLGYTYRRREKEKRSGPYIVFRMCSDLTIGVATEGCLLQAV
jgi:hypothetical protein